MGDMRISIKQAKQTDTVATIASFNRINTSAGDYARASATATISAMRGGQPSDTVGNPMGTASGPASPNQPPTQKKLPPTPSTSWS